TTIDDLLGKIPTRGSIEGGLLQEILAMAMLLADPDKTRRHGEGLLAAQAPTPELETDADVDVEEIVDPTEPESSELPASPTPVIPVIAETVSSDPDFTDLFDGIFDDELEAESSSDDWALEVLLDKRQSDLVTGHDADQANDLENSAEPATVTAGDDEEADDSDQDYWF
ncbi:DUF3150 domain-containing protein, partial [Methylomonas sp. WH-1]